MVSAAVEERRAVLVVRKMRYRDADVWRRKHEAAGASAAAAAGGGVCVVAWMSDVGRFICICVSSRPPPV